VKSEEVVFLVYAPSFIDDVFEREKFQVFGKKYFLFSPFSFLCWKYIGEDAVL
jgi:hypothetical protein